MTKLVKARLAPSYSTWLASILVLAVFGAALYGSWRSPLNTIPIFLVPKAELPVGNGSYQERFIFENAENFVHAPSVTQLSHGGLLAVWFEGSREGAADVQIMHSRFFAAESRWTEPRALISRHATGSAVGRYIRKLGNPVVATDEEGRVFLFYVSVSYGGWGGSAINWMVSVDNANTWSQPKRLITTPFLNVSTLVRNPPVFHEDGVIGLPVYHELLGKFPEYLLVSKEGKVIDKIRMNDGIESLQPSISAVSSSRALAVLRYSGDGPPRALGQISEDQGLSWSTPRALDLANPNSSIASVATGLADWPLLVAANDTEDDRFRLRLYLTDVDMKRWKRIHVADASPNDDGKLFDLRQDPKYLKNLAAKVSSHISEESIRTVTARICKRGDLCELQYEYPTLIRSPDGLFHLVYAWNDMLIKHVTFDQTWIKRQITRP